MAGTNTKAIALARSQIGYHEGRSNGHWNNDEKYAAQVPGLAWANGYAWCATFVSWVLYMTGSLTGLKATAAVANFLQQGMALGRFTEYPGRGFIAIYGKHGDVHTGIVDHWDDTHVWVVEGNTNSDGGAEGSSVLEQKRVRQSSFVYGYVIPFYDEHCLSADPKWNGKWLGQGTPTAATPAKANAVRAIAAPPVFSLSKLLAGIHSGKPCQEVKIVQHLLNLSANTKAAGVANLAEDGVWGVQTRLVFTHFQHLVSDHNKLNWTAADCDGYPGTYSTKALVCWRNFYTLGK